MWAAGDLRISPRERKLEQEDGGILRPRKRFRHARRYYRRLRREADAARLPGPGQGQSLDMWHMHPDMPGYGNRGGRHRRRHLAAGFTIFERYLAEAAGMGRPVQVYMTIHARDSSADAVRVHVPGSRRNPFPVTFPGVRWDVEPPTILREFLYERPWQLGRYEGSPGVYCVRPMEKDGD